ncbi:hypothetical protein MRY87_08595 [bacterium]|nr:hypothetical protein [bacterium]
MFTFSVWAELPALGEREEPVARLPEPFAQIFEDADVELQRGGLPELLQQSWSQGAQAPALSESVHRWSAELGEYEHRFHLTSWEQNGDQRDFLGVLHRIFPGQLESVDGGGVGRGQLFREVVSIHREGAQDGTFRWLTIRQQQAGEDGVWMYSPHLKRQRRMNGINREGSLFQTAVSLDDLLVFSALKRATPVGERDAFVLEEVDRAPGRFLVPFLVEKSVPLEKEASGCRVAAPAAVRPAHRLSFSGREGGRVLFAQWLRSENYVARDLEVVRYRASDPYRGSVYEVVLFDQELGLPIYRISYDHFGELRRSSYAVLAVAVSESGEGGEGELHVPVVSHSLHFDYEDERLSLTAGHLHRWCSITEERLAPYEPRAFGEHPQFRQ